MQVSDSGGTPQPLTTLSDGEVTIDGRRRLTVDVRCSTPRVGLAALPEPGRMTMRTLCCRCCPKARARSCIVAAITAAMCAAQPARQSIDRESGHIVYLNNGTLFAVPFSANELQVTGRAIPVIERVVSSRPSGGAQFSVSPDGTLVYLQGPSSDAKRAIDWMDRAGTTTTLRATRANWFNIQFAPDGRRLALQINDRQNEIWVYEQAQDNLTRLTFHAANDLKPVWTPDGRRITFASARETPSATNLYGSVQTAAVRRSVSQRTHSRSNNRAHGIRAGNISPFKR